MTELNLKEEQEHFCEYVRSLSRSLSPNLSDDDIMNTYYREYMGWLMAMRACFDEGWRT